MSDYKFGVNYYIEASAGTGKTYSIIQFVKMLISNKIPLEKILIVTYTEKAVEELKYRVRKEIKGVDVNDSEIYTIHSFCQKAIREYCVSCGKPINLDVIDEDEVESFVDRYIRDEKIYDDMVNFKNINSGFSIDSMKELLVSCVKKYYLNENWTLDDAIISIDPIPSVYYDLINAKSYEELAVTNPEFYNNVELLNEEERNDVSKALYQFVINHINPLKDDFLYPDDDVNQIANKNKLKDDTAKRVKDYLSDLKKGNKSLYGMLLHKYIGDLYKKWIEEKEKHQNQTFNDMIRYVREEVVSGGDLLDKLKKQYAYAIIDEFQDTNALQWDIFKGIFLDDKHHIVVVGDKKQSIYSFQGADVEVYKKAISDMKSLGSESKPLDRNYRSSEKMIKATNELFKTQGFMEEFFDSYYPDYVANGKPNEVKEATFDGSKDYKSIIIVDKHELRDNEFARVAASKIIECCEKVNGKTKLQISDGKGDFRNVTFKDFTVLSRSRSEVATIKREFKRLGIPFVGYKDTSLFSGRECVHWAALFDAINAVDFTGKNRKIFKRALFTNFFGKSLEDISDEKYDSDDLDEITMIKKWKVIASSGRYEDLIDSIIVDSNLESRMSSLNNIQSLSIYKQIGDYAIEYLSENHSLGELVANLENLNKKTNNNADKDINLISRSTNFDSVQIMTIHASKGLEFPVVIFAGNYRAPNSKGNVFTYHKEGRPVLSFSKTSECKEEEIDEWRRLYYVAFTRARYLLMIPNYRDFSKNKEYNFLKHVLEKFMEDKKDYYELINYSEFLYNRELLKEEVKKILKSNDDEDDFSKENQDEVLKGLIRDKKNKLSFKHSYSSLSHGGMEKVEDETTIDEDSTNKEGDVVLQDLSDFDKRGTQVIGLYDELEKPIALPSDFPKGAGIGTALHAMFELVDFSSYSDEVLDKVVRSAFEKEGIRPDKEWIKASKEIFKRVVSARLPVIHGGEHLDESFKLSSITLDNKKAEAEFNFNLFSDKLKNYANGFIDLLFKRGEYYAIVDWKSDVLNDYDLFSYASPCDLENHTNNRYSIQRVLYAYTLVSWLHGFYPDKSLDEVYREHFGGVYYVYIRGCSSDTQNGIYAKTWSSWDELKASYDEIINNKVRRH